MKILFADLLPGETPIDDASGLKLLGITSRKELNIAEAEGIRKVLRKYFAGDVLGSDVAPFDFAWAKRLHGEMFEDVWDWAGRFRLSNLNIGVPFGQIQERLYNLFEDLESWDRHEMDSVEQSAHLHHRCVEIHPFVNGNGRWARVLVNIRLHLRRMPPILWPENRIGEVSPIREEYIAALKAADQGDIGPLTKMHRDHLDRTS